MTLEEHNKTIAVLHIVYGGLHTLLLLALTVFLVLVFSATSRHPDAPPAAFFLVFAILGVVFALLFTVPSYVAGYAMLKRKPWGRVASLVAAVIEVLNFPFGTALGIYALWFLFGKGQALYAGDALTPGPRPALDGARADSDWFRGARSQQPSAAGRESSPPGQPPDWRGE